MKNCQAFCTIITWLVKLVITNSKWTLSLEYIANQRWIRQNISVNIKLCVYYILKLKFIKLIMLSTFWYGNLLKLKILNTLSSLFQPARDKHLYNFVYSYVKYPMELAVLYFMDAWWTVYCSIDLFVQF